MLLRLQTGILSNKNVCQEGKDMAKSYFSGVNSPTLNYTTSFFKVKHECYT